MNHLGVTDTISKSLFTFNRYAIDVQLTTSNLTMFRLKNEGLFYHSKQLIFCLHGFY